MKLIQQTTIRGFYEREVGDIGRIYPEQLQEELIKAEKHLAPFEASELWEYDDMGFLCGSRGVCVVKEGKILRSWSVFRA